MRIPTLTVAAFLLLAAHTAPAEAGESYGEGVRLTEATPIADILASPESYAGQRVRVEGEITDVCPRKGCWMNVRSAAGDELRVKVEDDVIVFPLEAQGLRAAAEGTVEVRELTREQFVSYRAHEAEEKGESFDASSIGEGPFRFVQLRGSGAEIGPAADESASR